MKYRFFADTINNGLFRGLEVVKPENLQELDSTENAVFEAAFKKIVAVNQFAKGDIPINEDKENTDMCYALQSMKDDARNEGKIETLAALVKDGLLDISEAAKRAGISVEDMKAML